MISRDTVASEATAPNNSGWARTTAISAAQSPPRATAIATSISTLAGSCTDRGARHGANAADMALSSPEQRSVWDNKSPPADDTSESRAESTTTEHTALRFTYGVPFHLMKP
ncbi:hypothetical protein BN000_00014 [Mycobacterium europaeum]|uniref:Uncharacterized protein n=1 Tax=Mycobacterium europaeum TaxID=761804 RepID=A0A0U1CVS4_9MYCO|nr:hypothetical protein BN000_00014 [Mycobacterium europaeum]